MLEILILQDDLSVCRLPAGAELPVWADGPGFCSITRTPEELSVVCPTSRVPNDVQAEHGWRLLKLVGPFPMDAVGILRKVADPLADAGISILPIGTFETDYLLVKRIELERAIAVLEAVDGLRVKRTV